MSSDAGVVVVGAGLAAAHVAETLRERGYDRPVTIVGDEGRLPYERPGLSKAVLKGDDPVESVYVHDQAWYDDHQVTTTLDDAATSVDRAGQTVTLASGATVPYTALVLATGARPRRLELPGAGLTGVHVLRTLPQGLELRDALTAGTRVVIIGAGWIGLEVAAAARAAGADVTILEYAALPLQRILGDQLGEHFAQLHRAHGVDLRLGVGVEAIEGDGARVTGVRVAGTVVPADVVLVAVGAVPDVALADAAGLAVDNGVLVDTQLRSSDPAILAAGDVANALSTALGEHVRVEHWDNAIRQGKLAARSILGDADAAYDWQPYFYTDQYDLGMEYVGHAGADDEVVIRGDLAAGAFVAFWLRGDAVRAAMNVNVWDVSDDLRALVGRTVPRARLSDPGISLTDL